MFCKRKPASADTHGVESIADVIQSHIDIKPPENKTAIKQTGINRTCCYISRDCLCGQCAVRAFGGGDGSDVKLK